MKLYSILLDIRILKSTKIILIKFLPYLNIFLICFIFKIVTLKMIFEYKHVYYHDRRTQIQASQSLTCIKTILTILFDVCNLERHMNRPSRLIPVHVALARHTIRVYAPRPRAAITPLVTIPLIATSLDLVIEFLHI